MRGIWRQGWDRAQIEESGEVLEEVLEEVRRERSAIRRATSLLTSSLLRLPLQHGPRTRARVPAQVVQAMPAIRVRVRKDRIRDPIRVRKDRIRDPIRDPIRTIPWDPIPWRRRGGEQLRRWWRS